MLRKQRGRARGVLVGCAVVWAGIAGPQVAPAANVGWERSGAFQACLETRMQNWVDAKAELVVSDNPAASELDDLTVALWTVEALETCETQVGRGDQTSELRFGRYMARWREHIHTVAEDIRRRLRPD
jgi:hypothetical protein